PGRHADLRGRRAFGPGRPRDRPRESRALSLARVFGSLPRELSGIRQPQETPPGALPEPAATPRRGRADRARHGHVGVPRPCRVDRDGALRPRRLFTARGDPRRDADRGAVAGSLGSRRARAGEEGRPPRAGRGPAPERPGGAADRADLEGRRAARRGPPLMAAPSASRSTPAPWARSGLLLLAAATATLAIVSR